MKCPRGVPIFFKQLFPNKDFPVTDAEFAGSPGAQPANNGDGAPYGAHVSIGAGDRAASLQIVPEGGASPVAECGNGT